MGVHTKLDSSLIDDITASIADGISEAEIITDLGITDRTWRNWINAGKTEGTIYADFYIAVRTARLIVKERQLRPDLATDWAHVLRMFDVIADECDGLVMITGIMKYLSVNDEIAKHYLDCVGGTDAEWEWALTLRKIGSSHFTNLPRPTMFRGKPLPQFNRQT